MDDDIDIEEHDLLDNPRIKSIFPDLSCVKIEIPDEDDVEEIYDELPDEADQLPQEMPYQYEYIFGSTHNAPEPSCEVEDNEYFFNNQIILGSKPSVNPEDLYKEALNSHPLVYLENWDIRLKTSACFCNICHILFPTVNALDAHKMISHSYLVALDTSHKNTARKSTVTSKFCNHCSKMFPDDTSLIKHLYELLPMNNFKKVKEETVEENDYKCTKCKITFPNSAALKWHEKNSHVALSNVVSSVQPKKIKIEKTVAKTVVKEKISAFKKLNREGKFFATSSLVPKSTLFQCRVCQICFISCFSAIQHAKSCEKSMKSEKCNVCKRKIRVKDAKIHALQHNYTDKLKIYTVNKNIYDKVLCRCPKCLACLDELGFWAHYAICKKHEKKLHCADCNLYIAANRYQSHRGKHSIKKLTKKDFIIIDFHDQNNVKTLADTRLELLKAKRLKSNGKNVKTLADTRLEILKKKRLKERAAETLKFRRKNANKIILYHCAHCGCCLYKLQHKGHKDASCKGHSKKICEKCGLSFTCKSIASHMLRHEKYAFTLKDIKIIDLFTGVRIEPPMTELYICNNCECHFIEPRLVKLHDCLTEKRITCKICSKIFNVRAYKVHKIFHSADKFMPELMKKYNSITNMWSVIFMCKACNLVTMTYDSVVNHCQKHLNFMKRDLRKHCSICDLDIAENEFGNHEILHKNNESIERASFKILMYDHEELFKKEWMSIFRPLLKQHREQILSNSIYRHIRSVKMQIQKTGATDDVTYICMNCKTTVEGATIASHLKSKCDRKTKFLCNSCRGTCKSLKNYLTHDCTIDNSSKRSTIVTFNNECDKEFNNNLSVIESECKVDKTKHIESPKPVKLKEVSTEVKKTFIIYKCLNCKVCVNLKKSVPRHRCVDETKRTFCRICQQYITSKKYRSHMEAHKNKPAVNKNTLSVVYFNVGEITENPVNAKIYKCNCGLHFTSLKSIQKHLDVCKPDLEISKEVCSKCHLMFPTEVLVTHLVNHHSKEVEIEIEQISRVIYYKCPGCFLLFSSSRNFNNHLNNCDPKKGSLCLDCNLNFGKNCFMKHKCSAKESYFTKIITMKKPVQISTVFQCEPCGICYLNYKSFKYHLNEVNHRNKTALVTCDCCGLIFTSNSYQKHIKVHLLGNNEYKIKVINAVSGDYIVISGSNTYCKDTYKYTPKKRKSEQTDSNTESNKRAKTDDNNADRKSMRLRKLLEMPSTSKSFANISLDDEKDNLDVSDDLVAKENGISSKLKARISVNNYDKKLFKCIYCSQHFMKEASFDYHIKTYLKHAETDNYKCDLCDLDFSRHTLPRHKYVHHKGMNLNREDFVIITETAYTRETNLFEKLNRTPKDNQTDSNIDDERELINQSDDLQNESTEDSEVGSQSTNKIDSDSEIGDNSHNDTQNGNDDIVNGKDESVNGNVDSDINETTKTISDNEKKCYFKCADCNVCFVDRITCYQHVLQHNMLDPKTYIQCKICDFQFLIDSLKDHMCLHHNTDFSMESLTIEEFKPLGGDLEPKIETYQAVDKVQSRLISTTTDMGVA